MERSSWFGLMCLVIVIFNLLLTLHIFYSFDLIPRNPRDEGEIIDFVGNITLDEYVFYFVKLAPDEPVYAGWTFSRNKSIYIVTNETSYYIWRVCNHEICHNIVNVTGSLLEESICYNIEETLKHPTCVRLMKELNSTIDFGVEFDKLGGAVDVGDVVVEVGIVGIVDD